MKLSNPKPKKCLIFSEMKLSSFIFFLYFRKEEKNFRKWKFIALSLKGFHIFLIFQERSGKAWKTKISYIHLKIYLAFLNDCWNIFLLFLIFYYWWIKTLKAFFCFHLWKLLYLSFFSWLFSTMFSIIPGYLLTDSLIFLHQNIRILKIF